MMEAVQGEMAAPLIAAVSRMTTPVRPQEWRAPFSICAETVRSILQRLVTMVIGYLSTDAAAAVRLKAAGDA